MASIILPLIFVHSIPKLKSYHYLTLSPTFTGEILSQLIIKKGQ